MRAMRLVVAAILAGAVGCSSDEASQSPSGAMGNLQPFPGSPRSPGGAAGAAPGAPAKPIAIDGFGRPPGMAIGTGAPDDPGGDDDGPAPAPAPSTAPGDTDDIAIPVFDDPTPPVVVPCKGCVELSAIVDDINQRSDFSFSAGGVPVTRIVWTILLPFNSDQLFIRSTVDGADGPYTFMSANVFGALNKPVQFVHPFTGTANNVGIALGSAGAWTGEQRISVFVDSVTLEGPNGVTRTFDTDAGGFAARGTVREPMVQFH